jgi:hypothetical protein
MYKVYDYETTSIGEIESLYFLNNEKTSYICDADTKKVRSKIIYDVAKVTLEQKPSFQKPKYKRKKSTWKPYY